MSKTKAIIDEIIEGFGQSPKQLPSKYFYDEIGSRLFDKITKLNEYYPTRTEQKIIRENIDEIGDLLGENIELIEPGSGSSQKTRILLDHVSTIDSYVPIDISGDYLFDVADILRTEYPELTIKPVVADYTNGVELPENDRDSRKIVFFPGSTIGNFELNIVQRFFSIVSDIIGTEGGLLIGVDLKKDIKVLEAAYNDNSGITAEFNKNILSHLNNLINTDFEPKNYMHKAVWVEEKGAIEMRLYSNKDHAVTINEKSFDLKKGEYLHTEDSHKYRLGDFAEMVSPWFRVKKVWVDENRLFSVQYLVPKL